MALEVIGIVIREAKLRQGAHNNQDCESPNSTNSRKQSDAPGRSMGKKPGPPTAEDASRVPEKQDGPWEGRIQYASSVKQNPGSRWSKKDWNSKVLPAVQHIKSIPSRGRGLAAEDNGRLKTELRAASRIPASPGATSASGSLLNSLPEPQDTRTGVATNFTSGKAKLRLRPTAACRAAACSERPIRTEEQPRKGSAILPLLDSAVTSRSSPPDAEGCISKN
ncbi:hypothetical protein NDU88_005459 [Pleurodeles waltl]|uniref:Uncharacterized protein n=1 Tax=Pleurodeles waltl TaxID=8319 RepID=A0AAV7RIK3_PLEWA|nr:hypothetical protein NDU88_005459 [Pleurodeles waltl]